jgi:hypothetical protein
LPAHLTIAKDPDGTAVRGAREGTMAKRWIGLTVVALCLGKAADSRAQMPVNAPPSTAAAATANDPLPYGAVPPSAAAAPMTANDPVPYYPSPAQFPGVASPPVMPDPGACPPVKGVEVPNGPNAFKDANCGSICGCYFDVGGMALQRERLGHQPIAVQDPSNIDSGNPPPPHAPLLLDLNQIPMDYQGGVEATLGYRWDCGSVEFHGFYLFRDTTTSSYSNPGRLDSFFYNPPLGFEGDNGMWLQADVMRNEFRSEVGSAEVMGNWWSDTAAVCELSGGVRFLDLTERLTQYTGDDDLTVRDINGNPDPTREATCLIRTQNRIVGPQLGFQVTGQIFPWLNALIGGKACVGANFLDEAVRLQRGDKFIGFSDERNKVICSQVYEVGAYLDWCFCEGLHLRTGWMGLFLVNVATAEDQFDFNLADTLGRQKYDGSSFYQGPVIELQFYF